LSHVLARFAILEGGPRAQVADAFRLISYARTVVARLEGDPRAEWELLHALASIEYRVDRLADAELHSRQALAWFERSGSPDPFEHAGLLIALAEALGDEGKLAEAIPLYERSRAMSRAALGPKHRQGLLVDMDLAVELLEIGRPAEAIPRQLEI